MPWRVNGRGPQAGALGRRRLTTGERPARSLDRGAGHVRSRASMDESPFRQFATWWADANVPMVLATAGPAARAVVLEEFDERGFCFWTSSDSPTGQQLAATPRAALVWLWDGRQARVEGAVERLSDEENARHWEGREGKRQLAAFAQSEPIESREALLTRLDAIRTSRSGLPSGSATASCRTGSSSGKSTTSTST